MAAAFPIKQKKKKTKQKGKEKRHKSGGDGSDESDDSYDEDAAAATWGLEQKEKKRSKIGEDFMQYLESVRRLRGLRVLEKATVAGETETLKFTDSPNIWVLVGNAYNDYFRREDSVDLITTTESVGDIAGITSHNLAVDGTRHDPDVVGNNWFQGDVCFYSGTLGVLAMTERLLMAVIGVVSRAQRTVEVGEMVVRLDDASIRQRILWECGSCDQTEYDRLSVRVPLALPILVAARHVESLADDDFETAAGAARTQLDKDLIEMAKGEARANLRGRGKAADTLYSIPMTLAFYASHTARLQLVEFESMLGVERPITYDEMVAMVEESCLKQGKSAHQSVSVCVRHAAMAVNSLCTLRHGFQTPRKYVNGYFQKHHSEVIANSLRVIREMMDIKFDVEKQRKRKSLLPY